MVGAASDRSHRKSKATHRDFDGAAETVTGSGLDIEGAYDNMDRYLLWDILEELGVNEHDVQLFREIHEDNQVQVTWEGGTCWQPVIILEA